MAPMRERRRPSRKRDWTTPPSSRTRRWAKRRDSSRGPSGEASTRTSRPPQSCSTPEAHHRQPPGAEAPRQLLDRRAGDPLSLGVAAPGLVEREEPPLAARPLGLPGLDTRLEEPVLGRARPELDRLGRAFPGPPPPGPPRARPGRSPTPAPARPRPRRGRSCARRAGRCRASARSPPAPAGGRGTAAKKTSRSCARRPAHREAGAEDRPGQARADPGRGQGASDVEERAGPPPPTRPWTAVTRASTPRPTATRAASERGLPAAALEGDRRLGHQNRRSARAGSRTTRSFTISAHSSRRPAGKPLAGQAALRDQLVDQPVDLRA